MKRNKAESKYGVKQVLKGNIMRNLKLFGASYAAGLIGDPDIRLTPIEIYLNMTGQKPLYDLSDNKRVQWGKRLENSIIDSFEKDYNVEMERQVTFYTPSNELYCATPDGIDRNGKKGSSSENWLKKGICLEVKNVASDKSWRYSQGVPNAEYCQLMWQAKIINEYLEHIGKPAFKLKQIVLRALFGGNEDVDFWTPVDEGFISNLTEVVDNFVATYVIPKKEPPPDSSKAYSDYLFRKFPEVKEPQKKKLLKITEDHPDLAIIEKYFTTRSQIKSLEAFQQKNENEIKALIEDKYGLQSPLGKILWFNRKGSVSWKPIAEQIIKQFEIPDSLVQKLIEQNTGNPSRSFVPYPKK